VYDQFTSGAGRVSEERRAYGQSSLYRCEHCSREFACPPSRVKKQGAPRYCSMACRDVAAKVACVCECGREFTVPRSRVETNGKPRWCSMECRKKYQGALPPPSLRQIGLTCKQCGGTFTRQARYAAKQGTEFCSNECKARAGLDVGRVVRVCANCRKEFTVQAARLKVRGARFCSWECVVVGESRRFWEKVDKWGGAACWTWNAATTPGGYGCFTNDLGEQIGAHQFAWLIHFGEIPEGKDVLHKCDNPPCVRPEHLFLGTQKDNMRDMVAKGRHWNQRWSDREIGRAHV